LGERTLPFSRKLLPGQFSELHVYDVQSGVDEVIYRDPMLLLEAPNWHRDNYLLLNGDGLLWKFDLQNSELHEVALQSIGELNNDHVLSSDHQEIFLSANDPWRIYRAPVAGGQADTVTTSKNTGMHFLHGVSFDGKQLAYVRIDDSAEDVFSSGRVQVFEIETGRDWPLVSGDGPEDGPEFSVDDVWVYFNTEHFSERPGLAQIAKVKRDGSGFELLTFDDRVNWFPHQSLCGNYWVYLSYPPGTIGHPADLDVQLRLVKGEDWNNPVVIAQLFGGQGTINVNSWSPHEAKFAYVSYPKI
jgi:hypothetical protein